MAIYFGNLDSQLADRQNVLKEDAARQYRGSRDTAQAVSNLGSTISNEVRNYGNRQKEAAILPVKIKQDSEQHKMTMLTNEINAAEAMRKSNIRSFNQQKWRGFDSNKLLGVYEEQKKEWGADPNWDAEEKIQRFPGLYSKADLDRYQKLMSDRKELGLSDDDFKNGIDKFNSEVKPLSFLQWAAQNNFYDDKLTGNPNIQADAMLGDIFRKYGYDVPDASKLFDVTQVSNNTADSTGDSKSKTGDQFLTKELTLYKGSKNKDNTSDNNTSDNNTSEDGKNSWSKFFRGWSIGSSNNKLLSDATNEAAIDRTRRFEGSGIGDNQTIYFDGNKGSLPSGNYGEGSTNLVMPGGLNIYDEMSNKTRTEKRELADLIFDRDENENKTEFLRYLNMDKDKHKDEYGTQAQRNRLKLSDNQQRKLTDFMGKAKLNTLIENYSYLKDFQSLPKELQLFLYDTSFNMGGSWLNDFTDFEKNLRAWVDTREEKYRRGMVEEFVDSDLARSGLNKNRYLSNIKLLQDLKG